MLVSVINLAMDAYIKVSLCVQTPENTAGSWPVPVNLLFIGERGNINHLYCDAI